MSKTPISASYGLTLYGTDGQYHSQPASAPSAPTGVTVGTTTTSTAPISWTASTAGTYSIAGYYVLVNGTLAATVSSGTSTTLTGLSAGTSYTVTVEAYDSQGTPLVSAASSPVTATTASASAGQPLTFQPVYDLVGAMSVPVTGASYSGTTATLTFSTPSSGAISTTHSATFASGSASITSNNNLVANQAVLFLAGTGALPSNIVPGTLYYVSATGLTTSAFKVSATPNGTPIVATGSPVSGTTVTIPMLVTVQGIGTATAYNGTFIATGGSSTSVTYNLPTAPSGTPTYSGAYLTITQAIALTDASGNNPVVGTAFSAAVQVQGGSPPYTYSFYQSPQATTIAGSGAYGYTGTTQNVWSINATTGVVTGTPGITEADALYVQVTDSAGTIIQSIFALGVLTAGVGQGVYPSLAGTALRNAIMANTPGGVQSIPSWLTTAPTGYTIAYPTAPNTLTTGQQTVTAITSYSNVVNIPGGTTPFTCSTSNTHYILQGNLACPGVAITIGAAVQNILIDLNGYTITYATANVTPVSQYSIDACGIGLGAGYTYGGNGSIEIINGTIQSGAGRTTNAIQGLYGIAPCPIRIYQVAATGGVNLYLRGLYLKWNNYSAAALGISSSTLNNASLIEYCTFEDYGWIIQNRTSGIYATGDFDGFFNIRNCKFLSIRHVAIGPSANVYDNEIWLDSWATNSACVSVETTSMNGTSFGMQVYSNNMYMTGCHPQSCFVGAQNTSANPANIYGNWMEGMYSRVGNTLPSATGGLDDAENYADGLTMKFGNPAYTNVYNNMMWTHAKFATMWNANTNVYQNSTARGLYYEGSQNLNVQANNYTGNLMAAVSADGNASCFVLGCGGNGNGLSFSGNRLITNRLHFNFAQEYDYSTGLTNNPTLTGNYIELTSVGGGLNYQTFSNQAELTWGSLTITSASVSGNVVTLNYANTTSSLGFGAPFTVSGVSGGSGINGSFPGSAVISITTTSMQYTSVGASGSGTGGTLSGEVVVGATLTGNTWVHGTWNGTTTPAGFTGTITGASGGASGTTPVSYGNLGPNMSYSFVNEPGAIL